MILSPRTGAPASALTEGDRVQQQETARIVETKLNGPYWSVSVLQVCDCPDCDAQHWMHVMGTSRRSHALSCARRYGYRGE